MSEETTISGRPSGSAATSRRITSSAISPGALNSTRTPRGADGMAGGRVAPSKTTVTSAPVRATSAPRPWISLDRCAASGSSPYPDLVTL